MSKKVNWQRYREEETQPLPAAQPTLPLQAISEQAHRAAYQTYLHQRRWARVWRWRRRVWRRWLGDIVFVMGLACFITVIALLIVFLGR